MPCHVIFALPLAELGPVHADNAPWKANYGRKRLSRAAEATLNRVFEQVLTRPSCSVTAVLHVCLNKRGVLCEACLAQSTCLAIEDGLLALFCAKHASRCPTASVRDTAAWRAMLRMKPMAHRGRRASRTTQCWTVSGTCTACRAGAPCSGLPRAARPAWRAWLLPAGLPSPLTKHMLLLGVRACLQLPADGAVWHERSSGQLLVRPWYILSCQSCLRRLMGVAAASS